MATVDELMAENADLLHAMQSGVKAKIDYALGDDHSPKHLRVGVNNSLISTGALVDLLLEKGIFTAEEFATSYNAALKREVEKYELELSVHLKTRVKLG